MQSSDKEILEYQKDKKTKRQKDKKTKRQKDKNPTKSATMRYCGPGLISHEICNHEIC